MNIHNFKKELKELLLKYNAGIGFSCSEDSDLYGIQEEKIIADIDGKDHILSYGYSVDANDIKGAL